MEFADQQVLQKAVAKNGMEYNGRSLFIAVSNPPGRGGAGRGSRGRGGRFPGRGPCPLYVVITLHVGFGRLPPLGL